MMSECKCFRCGSDIGTLQRKGVLTIKEIEPLTYGGFPVLDSDGKPLIKTTSQVRKAYICDRCLDKLKEEEWDLRKLI